MGREFVLQDEKVLEICYTKMCNTVSSTLYLKIIKLVFLCYVCFASIF